jgi:hypothetical protein
MINPLTGEFASKQPFTDAEVTVEVSSERLRAYNLFIAANVMSEWSEAMKVSAPDRRGSSIQQGFRTSGTIRGRPLWGSTV